MVSIATYVFVVGRKGFCHGNNLYLWCKYGIRHVTTIDQSALFSISSHEKEEMAFFKNIQMLITSCFYFALGY